MSNSPEIIKNAVDFTKAQSEGLGFHLNSKNEIKTHGKFTAFLYRIRDLFRFQTTINAEKAKLSEALQNILFSHYGITADPGESPNLSPAELDNLKHNIKLASDRAANFNKQGVDVKKLENAIHARLGTDLSSKELDTVKKEILRYGNSQLEAMRSLELKLQRQAADKNETYLMSSRQIEDYEGLVDSYLAEKASDFAIRSGANLSAKSAVITDEKELLSVIESEIRHIAKLYEQSVPKNLDAAVKEIRDFCSEGMTKDKISETVNDAIVSGLLNKYAAERSNVSNTVKASPEEKTLLAEIKSEIISIAKLYEQRVPKNLDAAVEEIKSFCVEGMAKEDISSIVNEAIVSGLLNKVGSQEGVRSSYLQEKAMPDCRMPAQNGNHIIQGQFFRQQPLSNTCFILSIFNGLCSSEQGARWLNDHVTQDLAQKGTLHFHPRDAENKGSDIEIDIHSPEVRQVRQQILRRTSHDCMSDFEAACANAYMKHFDKGYARAYLDPLKEIGVTSGNSENTYRPGDLGEAIVMANVLGLYTDSNSVIWAKSLKGKRQNFVLIAQDFLRNHKGIILFHKNGTHFTAVKDVKDNGDFIELDSLNRPEERERELQYDVVANSSLNIIFISFTKDDLLNTGVI